MKRREFLRGTATGAGAIAATTLLPTETGFAQEAGGNVLDTFSRPDSLVAGSGWESLNPGYWKIEDGTLRRRFKNIGDRARRTGFPFHSETHGGSFGPIGRSGGRAVIPKFGPTMKDFGRRLKVHCLYHKTHANSKLGGHGKRDPFYWNFLEMEFDTSKPDSEIGLRVRNLIDAPGEVPRGGGVVEEVASESGRVLTCKLPELKTLPDADVRFVHTDGRPIRGTRSSEDGAVALAGLGDIEPGTQVIVTAFDGKKSESQTVVVS